MRPDDGVHINLSAQNWQPTEVKSYNEQQLETFVSIFNQYDKNQDGKLNEDDNHNESEKNIVKQLKEKFDSFLETIGIKGLEFNLNNIKALFNKDLTSILKQYDKNGDDIISKDDNLNEQEELFVYGNDYNKTKATFEYSKLQDMVVEDLINPSIEAYNEEQKKDE